MLGALAFMAILAILIGYHALKTRNSNSRSSSKKPHHKPSEQLVDYLHQLEVHEVITYH